LALRSQLPAHSAELQVREREQAPALARLPASAWAMWIGRRAPAQVRRVAGPYPLQIRHKKPTPRGIVFPRLLSSTGRVQMKIRRARSFGAEDCSRKALNCKT